ncbi:hypothetical protein F4775DRAFT_289626 [Biscogniauxia sp. FL1348]|nr:hypothetical protein F4775DRAFT_289626 [Biscogniauxia sp. FL1348]
MSVHNNSPTSQGGSFSALLDSDEGLVDARHYTSNFTRNRPPHRNDRNLSSSQYNGPMTDSSNAANDDLATGKGSIHNLQGYAGSAPSTTESTAATTVKGDAGAVVAETPKPRKHLLYWINRDYDAPAERLTEQAVDALNHGTVGGDIGEWVTKGVYVVGRASPEPGGPDTSVGVLGRGTHSRVTTATGSSGSKGPCSSSHYYHHLDRMAENVCAAGWQFDDVPAFPARLADIDDADIA